MILISFDPKFFEAAVRSSLDKIWPRGFEERVHVVCTPKFMGNGKISGVQFADVTGWSRGPTTLMVTCSSKVMVTYLWEYAYVTKDDLSS